MGKKFWQFLTKKRTIKNWGTVGSIALLLFFILGALAPALSDAKKSEEWIRNRSVMLFGAIGQCSGEQVRAPSGVDYILTAGHCADIAEDGNMWVKTENGQILSRRVIAEDPTADLLLVEGLPGMEGLPIADTISRFEHVRTFTHGKGLMTYKTDGWLVQSKEIKIPLWQGDTDDKQQMPDRCFMPKMGIISMETFFGPTTICYLDVFEIVTTAKIVPGSSGGMVVDDDGKLAGVASATDEYGFGYLVRLTDIQRFIRAY